jgi:hypothetical protein
MEIRPATPEDASAACLVMRRSIADLCVADHGDDETGYPISRALGPREPPAPANEEDGAVR